MRRGINSSANPMPGSYARPKLDEDAAWGFFGDLLCAVDYLLEGINPRSWRYSISMHSGGKYVVITVFRTAVCQLSPSRYLLDLPSSC